MTNTPLADEEKPAKRRSHQRLMETVYVKSVSAFIPLLILPNAFVICNRREVFGDRMCFSEMEMAIVRNTGAKTALSNLAKIARNGDPPVICQV